MANFCEINHINLQQLDLLYAGIPNGSVEYQRGLLIVTRVLATHSGHGAVAKIGTIGEVDNDQDG